MWGKILDKQQYQNNEQENLEIAKRMFDKNPSTLNIEIEWYTYIKTDEWIVNIWRRINENIIKKSTQYYTEWLHKEVNATTNIPVYVENLHQTNITLEQDELNNVPSDINDLIKKSVDNYVPKATQDQIKIKIEALKYFLWVTEDKKLIEALAKYEKSKNLPITGTISKEIEKQQDLKKVLETFNQISRDIDYTGKSTEDLINLLKENNISETLVYKELSKKINKITYTNSKNNNLIFTVAKTKDKKDLNLFKKLNPIQLKKLTKIYSLEILWNKKLTNENIKILTEEARNDKNDSRSRNQKRLLAKLYSTNKEELQNSKSSLDTSTNLKNWIIDFSAPEIQAKMAKYGTKEEVQAVTKSLKDIDFKKNPWQWFDAFSGQLLSNPVLVIIWIIWIFKLAFWKEDSFMAKVGMGMIAALVGATGGWAMLEGVFKDTFWKNPWDRLAQTVAETVDVWIPHTVEKALNVWWVDYEKITGTQSYSAIMNLANENTKINEITNPFFWKDDFTTNTFIKFATNPEFRRIDILKLKGSKLSNEQLSNIGFTWNPLTIDVMWTKLTGEQFNTYFLPKLLSVTSKTDDYTIWWKFEGKWTKDKVTEMVWYGIATLWIASFFIPWIGWLAWLWITWAGIWVWVAWANEIPSSIKEYFDWEWKQLLREMDSKILELKDEKTKKEVVKILKSGDSISEKITELKNIENKDKGIKSIIWWLVEIEINAMDSYITKWWEATTNTKEEYEKLNNRIKELKNFTKYSNKQNSLDEILESRQKDIKNFKNIWQEIWDWGEKNKDFSKTAWGSLALLAFSFTPWWKAIGIIKWSTRIAGAWWITLASLDQSITGWKNIKDILQLLESNKNKFDKYIEANFNDETKEKLNNLAFWDDKKREEIKKQIEEITKGEDKKKIGWLLKIFDEMFESSEETSTDSDSTTVDTTAVTAALISSREESKSAIKNYEDQEKLVNKLEENKIELEKKISELESSLSTAPASEHKKIEEELVKERSNLQLLIKKLNAGIAKLNSLRETKESKASILEAEKINSEIVKHNNSYEGLNTYFTKTLSSYTIESSKWNSATKDEIKSSIDKLNILNKEIEKWNSDKIFSLKEKVNILISKVEQIKSNFNEEIVSYSAKNREILNKANSIDFSKDDFENEYSELIEFMTEWSSTEWKNKDKNINLIKEAYNIEVSQYKSFNDIKDKYTKIIKVKVTEAGNNWEETKWLLIIANALELDIEVDQSETLDPALKSYKSDERKKEAARKQLEEAKKIEQIKKEAKKATKDTSTATKTLETLKEKKEEAEKELANKKVKAKEAAKKLEKENKRNSTLKGKLTKANKDVELIQSQIVESKKDLKELLENKTTSEENYSKTIEEKTLNDNKLKTAKANLKNAEKSLETANAMNEDTNTTTGTPKADAIKTANKAIKLAKAEVKKYETAKETIDKKITFTEKSKNEATESYEKAKNNFDKLSTIDLQKAKDHVTKLGGEFEAIKANISQAKKESDALVQIVIESGKEFKLIEDNVASAEQNLTNVIKVEKAAVAKVKDIKVESEPEEKVVVEVKKVEPKTKSVEVVEIGKSKTIEEISKESSLSWEKLREKILEMKIWEVTEIRDIFKDIKKEKREKIYTIEIKNFIELSKKTKWYKEYNNKVNNKINNIGKSTKKDEKVTKTKEVNKNNKIEIINWEDKTEKIIKIKGKEYIVRWMFKENWSIYWDRFIDVKIKKDKLTFTIKKESNIWINDELSSDKNIEVHLSEIENILNNKVLEEWDIKFKFYKK